MSRRVGLLAGLLVVALGSGVVSQSPPPWLGGRVEMPEHGFAVTLPDGWVGFDTSADAVSQLEVAFDPTVWSANETEWVDHFAWLASSGVPLWSIHATSSDICELGPSPLDMSLGDAVDLHFEWYVDNPSARGVELQGPIDLAAGLAYHIRLTQYEPDLDVWGPASRYVLGTDEALLEAYCYTYEARPEDDWLSIVETFEILPAEEPSPPPWLGGRVEMPEHGLAVTVPDGWVAFDPAGDVDDQARIAAAILDPDASDDADLQLAEGISAIGAEGGQLALLETSTSAACGFAVGSAPEAGLAEVGDILYSLLSSDEHVTDVERPRAIELPSGAGTLVAAALTLPEEPGIPTPIVIIFVERAGSLLTVSCNGTERPEDDWLSIAATFEFLPEEE